jgi:tRNA (guanine9-N1)-methyltransferase
MAEKERPRKIQKVDHDESEDSRPQKNIEPFMTGALETSDTPVVEGSTDDTPGNAQNKKTGDTKQDAPQDDKSTATTMSKNQLKKLRRQQQWEEKRDERRAWRREKNQARRQQKYERLRNGEVPDTKLRGKRSVLVPITFVVDCNFDDLMNEKERISLASQLTRSYSDNNKAAYRGHLTVSSFEKLLKERFETVLAKSHENWRGVRFMSEDFVHAAELAHGWMKAPDGGKLAGLFENQTDAKPEDGEIIYLSSDSPDTLTELKPYSTYIVGGLVDKNRHKGICYKRATERGIKTAKLPIGEYLEMASRSVLTTNHVVEIMLKWLELGDWGEAFMAVIPKRKGGVLKNEIAQQADEAIEGESDAGHEQDSPVDEQSDQETGAENGDTVDESKQENSRLNIA